VNWISSAELARRAGVSRPAVTKAIATERINPANVRRTGGRVLVDEAAGLAVLGHHKQPQTSPSPVPAPVAVDDGFGEMLAWGSGISEPAEPIAHTPDALTAELARLRLQLERVQYREKRWISCYHQFRSWFASWTPRENFTNHLWKKLGAETPGVVDTGNCCVELVLAQLRDLDECEVQSRFPGPHG
jgi:hypothetical protein